MSRRVSLRSSKSIGRSSSGGSRAVATSRGLPGAAIEKHHARDGSVTVIDPRTGEILAMASWPSYDPNDPRDIAKRSARNRPVTDAYEPGSTMKTFSVAAALEAGVVKPTDGWD